MVEDPLGRAFVQTPENFIRTDDDEEKLISCVNSIISDLLVDLNAEMVERSQRDEPFDYKREFKSPNSVRGLTRDILSAYQKLVNRGRSSSFSQLWEDGAA